MRALRIFAVGSWCSDRLQGNRRASSPNRCRAGPAGRASRVPLFWPTPRPRRLGAAAGCFLDGVHDHEYAPENISWYRHDRGVYYYSAPIVMTYWNAHPDEVGGWCYIHGAHAHSYYPPRGHSSRFHWDRARRHYAYDARPSSRPAPRRTARPTPEDRSTRPARPRTARPIPETGLRAQHPGARLAQYRRTGLRAQHARKQSALGAASEQPRAFCPASARSPIAASGAGKPRARL